MVSVWLALGPENDFNGGLHLVPGSHAEKISADRFDAKKFLRDDLPANQALIDRAIVPELQAGDVMFFHSNTLHAAGQNQSDAIKFSPVFTYHAASNNPTPGTRSAAKGSVPLV
jgi:phytanoyl-CoA hydroxylase